MASLRVTSRCQKCVLNLLRADVTSKQPVRNSQYNPAFLEPTYKKDEVDAPMAEDDPRKFSPIKAAVPEQSTSFINDDLINKFIRHILREGNKERARNIVDKTFEKIKFIQLQKYHKAKTDKEKERIEINASVIFHKAVENCTPLLITRDMTRGGVMYQVPVPAGENYKLYKAMKWLIESSMEKDRSVRIWDTFAYELIEASQNEGKSVRKKQELHRVCEANRAYAHFRW